MAAKSYNARVPRLVVTGCRRRLERGFTSSGEVAQSVERRTEKSWRPRFDSGPRHQKMFSRSVRRRVNRTPYSLPSTPSDIIRQVSPTLTLAA